MLPYAHIDTRHTRQVLSAGMKPLVELSFTPNPLASGKSAAFHYAGPNSPPRDMDVYGEYVRDFIAAIVSYFGEDEVATWAFEVI